MKTFDAVAKETGIARDICKSVIYCILLGGDLISYMQSKGLVTRQVVAIRESFDTFITIEGEKDNGGV